MGENVFYFRCGACRRQLRWQSQLAGKQVMCKCGQKMVLPAEAPQPRPQPQLQTQHQAQPNPTAADPFLDALKSLDEMHDGSETGPRHQSKPVKLDHVPSECLHCRAPVSPNAKICIQCGNDLTAVLRGKRAKQRKTKVQTLLDRSGAPRGVGLKIAGAGLLLHSLGFLIVFVSLIVLTAMMANEGFSEESLKMLAASGPSIGIMVGFVAIIIGPVLALAVPGEAGRGYLEAGIGCYAACVGLEYLANQVEHMVLFSIASGLVQLFGTAFLIYFQRELASYLGNSRLEASVDGTLKLYTYALTAYIIAIFIAFIPVIGSIILIGISLALLVVLLRYIFLSTRLGLAVLST